MSYRLEFSHDAVKQLRKIDKHQAMIISRWLYANIDGIADPTTKGKALAANLAGLWRYRVGDYRIICELQADKLVVLTLSIGHRRDIYG